MTLNEIKLTLEAVLNKHSSGNTLTPQEYNTLLKANILSFVRDKVAAYRQMVIGGVAADDVMFTMALMESLQKTNSPTLTGGAFTLPADFLFMCDLYGKHLNKTKRIEPISPEEYSKRVHNVMAKPMAYFPVCIIAGTSCRVYPDNMTNLFLEYIGKPTTPVYDYYIDANYNIVYLAASATHTLTAGEVGSAGQTSGTVTSLTVELTIPEEMHMMFTNYILSNISIKDRDQLLYQAAQNEK